jgi:hypothetical protein
MFLPFSETLDQSLFMIYKIPVELRQIIIQYHGYMLDPKFLTKQQFEYVCCLFNEKSIPEHLESDGDVFLVYKVYAKSFVFFCNHGYKTNTCCFEGFISLNDDIFYHFCLSTKLLYLYKPLYQDVDLKFINFAIRSFNEITQIHAKEILMYKKNI